MISEIKIPKRIGFRIIQNADGSQSYEKLPKTIDTEKIEKEVRQVQQSNDNDEILLDLVYKVTLLEWGVTP